MFIEIDKGDFIALDTVARITYWSKERDHTITAPPVSGVKDGYRIETKRGEKHNVTDPLLMANIQELLDHE